MTTWKKKSSLSSQTFIKGGFIDKNSLIDAGFRNMLLNHLFNSSILGIFIVNTDGVFLDANDALLSLIGYSRKELLAGKITRDSITAPEYRHLSDYAKKTLRQGGETNTYEKEYIRKDGSRVPVLIAVSRIGDTKDLGIGFVLDITERKESELRTKERERQFRHLVDANVIGVVIKSLDGPIFEANDIFLKMVGYSRADLNAGKVNWKQMTPPEYLPKHPYYEKQILEKGAAKPFEKEYIRKDGTRIPVLLGDVLLDKKTKKTITFILDITRQKELEKRKDEFIALASHELKTPLTSLRLYPALIEKFTKRSQTQKALKLLSDMEKQIDKMTELVNDLLDVSRIQSGKLQYRSEVFSFDKLIIETIDDLQRVTPRHKIVLKGQTKVRIKADRERIKQVFTNLLTNAIKYSPRADKLIVQILYNKGSVQVSVQDFGIGIPKVQQEKIFDRFFQVERPLGQTYPGLGLGLYITKEIIDRHRGKIWVESKAGKGSTFFFALPLKDIAVKTTKSNKNP